MKLAKKDVAYDVYQNDKLILKLTDKAGDIDTTIYSSDVALRMLDQGELREDQLEISVGFKSKPVYLAKKVDPKASKRPDADSGAGLD
jgi:hypothetical protein